MDLELFCPDPGDISQHSRFAETGVLAVKPKKKQVEKICAHQKRVTKVLRQRILMGSLGVSKIF